MDKAKPFDIPKREVWEAFKKVKANQGAAGVDRQTIADFEADLSNNLYELWNRLSSGSYFPFGGRGGKKKSIGFVARLTRGTNPQLMHLSATGLGGISSATVDPQVFGSCLLTVGHLAPGRLLHRVAREGGHLLAFLGMATKCVSKGHGWRSVKITSA